MLYRCVKHIIPSESDHQGYKLIAYTNVMSNHFIVSTLQEDHKISHFDCDIFTGLMALCALR